MNGRRTRLPSFGSLRRYVYALPAIAVAVVVASVEIATEHFNDRRFENERRASAMTALGTLRARVEGAIYSDAQLVRGMVAAIAIEPNLSEERFAALASQVFLSRSHLRNIAAAPDLVIRYMYPMEGNEAAIGLDYRENTAQREAAERARDVGEIVLAGPVDLIQGGQGFISRMPVFIPQKRPGERKFWGLVSAVIDVEKLYRDSGVLDDDLPIEIAIRGKDALGADGVVFFGRERIFESDPVVADIILPHGSWQIAAIPKGGWPEHADTQWIVRFLFLLAGVLLISAALAGAHLLRQRKISERAVQQSEARLRSIMDNAPVAIFLKDREGHILAANQTHLDRRKLTADQAIGRTAYSYNPKEVADEISSQEQLVIETGKPRTFEVTRDLPNGGERVLMVVRFPVIAGDNEIIGVGGISIDVTDRTLMERQLIQAQKMEVVGQLTGGVAHDFNNLLQVIESSLELAKMQLARIETADSGKIAEILDNALMAGRRGAGLTQKLLAFSRKQTLRPQKIRTRTLIDSFLTLLSRTLGEDIRIETDLDGDQTVLVDETGLTNALLNLAVNSRAAMPQGGTLTISVANRHLTGAMRLESEVLPPGDYVEFTVADTGVGMSQETLKRAFEPFFTTKDVGEGSGLGLSMVYGFARQSGGNVAIESEPGKGTKVRILLPSAGEVEMPTIDDEIPMRSDGHTIKVLVVEDDADVRASTVFLLEALGCEVLEAENAAPVLVILEKDRDIDLLLSDVVLPGGKNGIELAQEARRLRPDLKVILVSGYPEGTLQRVGLADSAFPLLSKPFSIDILSQTLSSIMAR